MSAIAFRASSRNSPAEYRSSGSRMSMSRCGARPSTSRPGLPVPMSRCRNTSAESTLTISKGPRSASVVAMAVLPAAVGPIRKTTGPAP